MNAINPKPATVFDLFNGHPERWTKGVDARDAAGNEVSPKSEIAACFCVYGAIEFVYGNYSRCERASNKFARLIDCGLVSIWQDDPSTTFDMMLAKVKESGI